MKKIFGVIVVAIMLVSCDPGTGHLTGVQGRKPFFPEIPLGMVYIHAGSFTMGQSDEDVPFLHQSRSRVVSIPAFYMDNTEITNNEYREFVYWVRDSIALEMIYEGLTDGTAANFPGEVIPDRMKTRKFEDQTEIDPVAVDMLSHPDVYFDGEKWVVMDEEFFDSELGSTVGYDDLRKSFPLSWSTKGIPDVYTAPLISNLFLKEKEEWYGVTQLDTRKLNFKYYWIDIPEAAKRGEVQVTRNGYKIPEKGGVASKKATLEPNQEEIPHRRLTAPPGTKPNDTTGFDADLGWLNKKGQNNAIRGHKHREKFIIDEIINVYPDTLCWARDFTYSFNDPMVNMYFWHPAYDNYPVVGVTWQQARAFCVWRTQKLNNWLTAQEMMWVQDFRLPTEAEWEYASRGDLKHSPYPWGGPYIRNSAGCMLGNFKPMRGRYFDDGGFYPVKAYSYNPNGYGLYCMSGNVAEWTETAFDESASEFTNSLTPEYRYYAMDWDPPVLKRKVIRGGSWKDVGYYLQTGTRTYEYQDTTKSYLGYRCVQTHIGRGGSNFDEEGGEELKSDIELR